MVNMNLSDALVLLATDIFTDESKRGSNDVSKDADNADEI